MNQNYKDELIKNIFSSRANVLQSNAETARIKELREYEAQKALSTSHFEKILDMTAELQDIREITYNPTLSDRQKIDYIMSVFDKTDGENNG